MWQPKKTWNRMENIENHKAKITDYFLKINAKM